METGNAVPWILIENPVEKYEVYGFFGKSNKSELLEGGMYTTVYDKHTVGKIIII